MSDVPARSLDETVERLCRSSRRTLRNPYERLGWPDDPGRPAWFTSPELVSIHRTPTWDALSEEQRMEVSFWEAVAFYSLNIHGERLLMEGLARRLYRPGLEGVTDYLHHMLDEENKHSVWFGEFCRRYAGRVYPDRTVAFPRSYERGEEDFLFFAQVLVFEELVDRYNVVMGRDERLSPVARQINADHHDEEVRHLIFGRRVVADLWDTWSPGWSAEAVAGVRRQLAGFLVATWRSYYSPDAYRDAGLVDPAGVREEAWAHLATREHRRSYSARAVEFLVNAGIFEEEPAL